MPSHHTVQLDLATAGIPKADEQGRTVDFHALRYTFATNLHRSGVSFRIAQQLMRHTDPRLTANIYTDAQALDTAHAVNRLPRLGPNDAAGDACFIDATRSEVSSNDSAKPGEKSTQVPVNKGDRRAEARSVATCHRRGKKWSRGDSNPRVGTVSKTLLQRVVDPLISA